MRRAWIRLLLMPIVAFVVILLGGLACSDTEPTETPQDSTEWTHYTSQTASYRITLRMGPVVSMDVMQSGAPMTTVDRGQPVNHHLEVHVFDKSSGAEVKDLVPSVTITDLETGDAREFAVDRHPNGEVPFVTACLLADHRVEEPHFGDNLHLRDGTYTIAIGVGNESAVLENISVKAMEPSGV